MDEHNCSTHASANGIAAYRRNSATGSVGGRGGSGGRDGNGGRSVGNGEEGNGGGTTTPSTGTAVIPLYAAGAANNHHNSHHAGAGSCNRSCLGLPTFCAVILVSLTIHIYIILGIENLMKPA